MPCHSSLITGRGQRHDLSGPPLLVCENVEDYRNTIKSYLHAEDIVLELGCAQGVTTGLIGMVVKEVVGIDKSIGQAMRASERSSERHEKSMGSISFECLDAFDVGGVLKKFGRVFTVIYVDISGNRSVGDVVSLCDKYFVVFRPRLIVVKCYKMKRLCGMCRVFPDDMIEGPSSRPFSGREHEKLSRVGQVLMMQGTSVEIEARNEMGMTGKGPLSHPIEDE